MSDCIGSTHFGEIEADFLEMQREKIFREIFSFWFEFAAATSWKNLRRADGESFETETWNKVRQFPHICLTANLPQHY